MALTFSVHGVRAPTSVRSCSFISGTTTKPTWRSRWFILRHEAAVLRRQIARPALQTRRSSDVRRLQSVDVERSPRPVLGATRDPPPMASGPGAKRWTYTRPPGRQREPAGTVALVIRLDQENPSWGSRRIRASCCDSAISIRRRTDAVLVVAVEAHVGRFEDIRKNLL